MIEYHFVWVTKYRYRVVKGEVGERVWELVRQTCEAFEIRIVKGVVSKDHVPILVSAPPELAPSEIMRRIKGRSASKLFEEFAMLKKRYLGRHFWARSLLMSKATMVDATIIHAPSSTNNAKKQRNPEMHQTKKRNQWFFGAKIHVGADVDSGAVHRVTVTAANPADIQELPNLLRAEDEVIFGDAGYASDEYKRGSRELGIHWAVQDKGKPGHPLSTTQKKRNRKRSRVRARVEHVFRVIKRQFGYVKTRYKGLQKNAAQVDMLVGLANLSLLRGRLMAA